MIVFEQRIGKLLVRVEGEDIKELFEQFAFLAELPETCPLCEHDVNLSFHMAKGFSFYGMSCNGRPRHATSFGQFREGGGLFYKGDGSWAEAFQRGGDEEDYSGGAGGAGGPAAAGWAAGHCITCGIPLTAGQAKVSMTKYQAPLCPHHQKEHEQLSGTAGTGGGNGGAKGGASTAPTAQPAPSLPGPPPTAAGAAGSHPDARAATPEERARATEWVEYAHTLVVPSEAGEELGFLGEAEYKALTAELAAPATSVGRCRHIANDLQKRTEATLPPAPAPAGAAGAAGAAGG